MITELHSSGLIDIYTYNHEWHYIMPHTHNNTNSFISGICITCTYIAITDQAPSHMILASVHNSTPMKELLSGAQSFVGSCLATKVFTGNLPAMERGWVIIK